MIQDILAKLHLSEKEIQIYLALVKLGPSSAAQVSKETGILRQTIYSILQHMVTIEFVDQTDRHGVKYFSADPQKLFFLIEKQKTLMEEQRRALDNELPKILAMQTHGEAQVKVQYYEGKGGQKRLLDSILDLYKRGKSKEFRGYGVNSYQQTLGDYFYQFVKRRHKYGVVTKLFIGQGADDFAIEGDPNTYGRQVKRLEMEPQKSGVYLVGNRVYLFSFEDNVGVMVENAAIVKLLQNVFEDLWKRIGEK